MASMENYSPELGPPTGQGIEWNIPPAHPDVWKRFEAFP